ASSIMPKSSPSTASPTASRKPTNVRAKKPGSAAGVNHDAGSLPPRPAAHPPVRNPSLLDTRTSAGRSRTPRRSARAYRRTLSVVPDRTLPAAAHPRRCSLRRRRRRSTLLTHAGPATEQGAGPAPSLCPPNPPSSMRAFRPPVTQGNVTKKELAIRLGKDPAQITRWLSAPSNFELDTLSDILLAM